jgi:hypothetical protein
MSQWTNLFLVDVRDFRPPRDLAPQPVPAYRQAGNINE